jgi:hypothetical protein
MFHGESCDALVHGFYHSCAGSGDVKYHLGTSYDRPTNTGKTIHLSLLANPSHLEAVNTIVLGKCRARQFYENDDTRRGTMPILLHGDGAFSGQVAGPIHHHQKLAVSCMTICTVWPVVGVFSVSYHRCVEGQCS